MQRPDRVSSGQVLPIVKGVVGLLAAAVPAGVCAQTALSFDAAQARFERTSHAVSAADHGVAAAKSAADALKTLHRPIVTAGGLPSKAIGADLAAIAIGGTVVANMAVKIGVTLAFAKGKGKSAAIALLASTLVLAATLVVAWFRLEA